MCSLDKKQKLIGGTHKSHKPGKDTFNQELQGDIWEAM